MLATSNAYTETTPHDGARCAGKAAHPLWNFLTDLCWLFDFGPLEKLYDSQLGGLYRLQATAYCPPGSASGAPLSAAHGPRSNIGRVGSLQFFPRVIVAATKVLSTSYTLEHSLLQVGEVYGDLFLVPDGYTSQVSLIQMGASYGSGMAVSQCLLQALEVF